MQKNRYSCNVSQQVLSEVVALGENCIKIISQDKSNSLGMFLEIQRDIGLKCHVTASFMLTCSSQFHAKSCCLSVREKSMVLLSI